MPRFETLQQTAVLLLCGAYVAVNGWFMLRHVLGDTQSTPAAYFFTWDMFPGYVSESSRRMAVGVTTTGRYIKLLPAENHRFRWGINNAVSRMDIDHRHELLLPQLEASVRQYNRRHPDDPIQQVGIVEQYWPSKFNLPDDIYQATYDEPNPRRRYWRHGAVWRVDDDGRLIPGGSR